ncbi:Xylulose kinase [compost metagenome]
MQADIFNATIIRLESEQGPALGAAMLAAYGAGWFGSLEECAAAFIRPAGAYQPNPEQVKRYEGIYSLYQDVYGQTRELNRRLAEYRN